MEVTTLDEFKMEREMEMDSTSVHLTNQITKGSGRRD
jgi:hypothetical protein